ncbi:MAG: HEAT repeat domain-containing protein [Candidatus Thiodiazotropha sp. (ex Lucinoma kastoroae)]|nr:HEAT repeat domain-containing protein [Candidatus Thiodiazotropha sp. (ex Lucinoma kastoroae)]
MSSTPFASGIQSQLRHDLPYAWFRWHQAVLSPQFRKQHLVEMNDRLEAYLDCYLISEASGSSIAETVKLEDWGAIFAIGITAILSGDMPGFQRAVEAMTDPRHSEELSDALCRIEFKIARPYLLEIAHHPNPLARIAAIKAAGYHTQEINETWLTPMLQDASSEVRIAALEIIGDNQLSVFAPNVRTLLTAEDEAIRFSAAYAGSLIGIEEAYPVLTSFCSQENPYLRKALGLLYSLLEHDAILCAIDRIQDGDFSIRIKTYNIAMAGLPEKIPHLIDWMKNPEYAQLAVEAFSFITGADFIEEDLDQSPQEIAGYVKRRLKQDRKQDHWSQAYEDDLPWPNPEAVEVWWENNQSRFQPGTRYLAGRTLTEENLRQVIEVGTQPQRLQAELIIHLYHAGEI